MQGCVRVSSDAAKLICVIPQGISNAILHNIGPATIYIGGQSVQNHGALMGLPIAAGEKLGQLDSYEFDATDLYGITADGDVADMVFLVLSP